MSEPLSEQELRRIERRASISHDPNELAADVFTLLREVARLKSPAPIFGPSRAEELMREHDKHTLRPDYDINDPYPRGLNTAAALTAPVKVTPIEEWPNPEWQYGVTTKWGTFGHKTEAYAHEYADALRAAIAAGRESGDLQYHGKVVRRKRPAPAGPWIPLDSGQAEQ